MMFTLCRALVYTLHLLIHVLLAGEAGSESDTEGRTFVKEERCFGLGTRGRKGERGDWAEGDLSCDVVLTKSSASPWEALELGWASWSWLSGHKGVGLYALH